MAYPSQYPSDNPEGDPFYAPVTTEVLTGICQEMTEDDSRFAEHLVPRTCVAYEWDTFDGVTYSVSLTGMHEYKEDDDDARLDEEPTYLGRSYHLAMEVSYDLGVELVPEELLAHLRGSDIALPDDINDLAVTYGVQLSLSPAGQLSWQAVRFYDIEYVAETIDTPSMQLVTDTTQVPLDYTEVDMEISRLSQMRVALMQSDYAATPFTTEMLPKTDETQDEMFERLAQQLIDSCLSDPEGEWLTRAVSITEMIKFRSEGDFDLAIAFPDEVLEAIRES